MKTVGPEQVTEVLQTWLQQEIEESDRSRNAVLSDFELRKEDFQKDFDDPTNLNAAKVKGHYGRLRLWAPSYAGQFDNDFASARLTFCSLMTISGSFREYCFLNAPSAEAYVAMRHQQGPTSVDVRASVEDEFRAATSAPKEHSVRIEDLIDRTMTVNESNLRMHKLVHSAPLAKDNRDLYSVLMQRSQSLWLGLAAAQIMVAAELRDNDYERVPFFEPKSITDQTQLLYPFAS